jgi:hypothetical protein
MNERQTAVAVVGPQQEEESHALVPFAVTPPETTLPTRGEIDVMALIASRAVLATGLVPKNIDTADKAFAVMLAGWEAGLKPMTALRHVYVVNGRTELDAQAMMGVVLARDPGARFTFHQRDETACDVSLQRFGRKVVRIKYTLEDAERSGQAKKDGPWQLYRADMLAWNAIRRCCRFGASDLINTVSGVDVGEAGEMMGDLPDDEDPVIDAEALPAGDLVNEGDESATDAEEPPAAPESEAEPEPPAPPEEPAQGEAAAPHFRNIRDFFRQAIQELKYKNIGDILTALGCQRETDIADLDAAWLTLVEKARA